MCEGFYDIPIPEMVIEDDFDELLNDIHNGRVDLLMYGNDEEVDNE